LLAALALWGWGFMRSTVRVDLHAGPKRVVDTALAGIDAEVSRSPAEATVYLESGANSQTMLGFVMRDVDFPGRAAIFLLTHHDDRVDGRTVRFVIRDPQILAHYRQRPESPLARLMGSPQEAGRWRGTRSRPTTAGTLRRARRRNRPRARRVQAAIACFVPTLPLQGGWRRFPLKPRQRPSFSRYLCSTAVGW